MFLAVENPLNSSALVFPVLECLHIVGFALSVGTIAIVDFRLLGLGMRHQAVAEVAADLAPWTLVGLALMLTSGPLLFSSDPDMYYLNRAFQIKMVLLLLAIIFNYTIHRKAAVSPAKSPFRNKLVACVSIALWVGVIFCGIFIAFI
jgi:hypothetical protein